MRQKHKAGGSIYDYDTDPNLYWSVNCGDEVCYFFEALEYVNRGWFDHAQHDLWLADMLKPGGAFLFGA